MANQAQTVEVPYRWPLVQALNPRAAPIQLGLPQQDPRLINCYAEYDAEIQGHQIQKRFGTRPATTSIIVPGYPIGAGATNWSFLGLITPYAPNYSIWADNISGTATLTRNNQVIGTVGQLIYPGFNSSFNFAATQSSSPVLAMLNGAGGWYTSNTTVGSFTLPSLNRMPIPSINFGSVYVGLCYMDGVLYAMDTGCNIFGSNTDDPTTWDPLNVILANAVPGQGTGLIRHRNYLIALKNTSMEVFATNPQAPIPGSALQPVKEATAHLGCLSRDSIQTIDDIGLWLTMDVTQANMPQVVLLDNLSPTIVSTPGVERLLSSSITDNIRSMIFRKDGHRFYVLTLVISNITLVFDIDQRLWYIWSDASGNALQFSDAAFNDGGLVLWQHANQGINFVCDSASATPTDNGLIFPVDIYTPNYDAGTKRGKMLSAMYFNVDQVNAQLAVRYNDNDYQSGKWSNFRTLDLRFATPTLTDEGTFRKRAYHFRHMAATDFRIRSVDLQLDLCTL